MDSDWRGDLFCRLLRDDLGIGDMDEIEQWELPGSVEEVYFDNIQKIDKEIEGLKKFQLMQDTKREPEPRTMCEKLLKKLSKRQKLTEKVLMAVIFKKIEDSAKQEKEWKLVVAKKNEEIKGLRREAELRWKELDEKSMLTEELETTLREAEEDRAKKLAEKDLKIKHMLAEKDRLIQAHSIECNVIRSTTERSQAKFGTWLTALDHFRTATEVIFSDRNSPERKLSITCLKSGNQETESPQAKRERDVEAESTLGSSEGEEMKLKKVKTEKES